MSYDYLTEYIVQNDQDFQTKSRNRIYFAALLKMSIDHLNNNRQNLEHEYYTNTQNILQPLLKDLESKPGGLTKALFNNLIEMEIGIERISKEELSNYVKVRRTELVKYDLPVFGKPKLKKEELQLIQKFAHSSNTQLLEENKRIPFREIVIRRDLYPRGIESNIVRTKIDEYTEVNWKKSENKPIVVNQKNELIDGYLRLMAMKRQNDNSDDFYVNVTVIKSDNDRHLKHLIYSYNSKHGFQYTNDQKRLFAIDMARVDNKTDREIAEILGGVHRTTVNKWTQSVKMKKRSELEKKIVDLRIKHGYTQKRIAKRLNVKQRTVSNILSKNAKMSKVAKEKAPSKIFSSNYWTLGNKKSTDKYAGKTDEVQLENLLYYHTEPEDNVVDIFAGSGTLFDVCDRMGRDCQLYSLNQYAGREHIIKKWNIRDGLPPDMPVFTHLLFFDPPYWNQKRYTIGNSDDLSNMTLEDYNQSMRDIFNNIKNSHTNKVYILKIAILVLLQREMDFYAL